MFDIIREIACAVRMGDMAAADKALDGIFGGGAAAVSFGRADADRKMRREEPLPPLTEPHEREFDRNAEMWAAERKNPELAEANTRLLNAGHRSQRGTSLAQAA